MTAEPIFAAHAAEKTIKFDNTNLSRSPTKQITNYLTGGNNNFRDRGRDRGRGFGSRFLCQVGARLGHIQRIDATIALTENSKPAKPNNTYVYYTSPDVAVNRQWLCDSRATNYVTNDQGNMLHKTEHNGRVKLMVGNGLN